MFGADYSMNVKNNINTFFCDKLMIRLKSKIGFYYTETHRQISEIIN